MADKCIIHQAMGQLDEGTFYICARCRPLAQNLLANLQLEIDTGLMDPGNADDERVGGYRILKALLPEGR
jgi:hypothetical protein